MAYVSELVGKPVTDIDGEKLGTVKDLLAAIRGKNPHPQIIAIVVKGRGADRIISVGDVAVLLAPAVPLKVKQENVSIYTPADSDLWLVEDVLDKQIIDMDGVRVVRVNDLELTRVNEDIYVSNVDIGTGGLFRRMGLGSLARISMMRPNQTKTTSAISWDDVELLGSDQPMRLKVPADRLVDLHPADLAEIISDLNRSEGREILETLDAETVADALEEVEPEFQASLLEEMADEKVADVLEKMAPDEAADLLAELPDDRSQQLLDLMEDDEAEDVRELLTYPEESAGGIMNTEFVSVRPDLTAAQTMEYLRHNANEAETIYYIYVTDEIGHLQGVFSLRQLVLSEPLKKINEFMEDRVVSVKLLDKQDTCAQLVSKYNLLALPVVDDDDVIHGIITADDALDKIIPTAWKKRLPRMYH
jgi:sporulation protein YlmC with PRC-barrel domain/CBS domain-containing protein